MPEFQPPNERRGTEGSEICRAAGRTGRSIDRSPACRTATRWGRGTCDVPVRFVLRNPGTRDVVQFDTRTSLCTGPHNDSPARIRAVVPEVTVEG